MPALGEAAVAPFGIQLGHDLCAHFGCHDVPESLFDPRIRHPARRSQILPDAAAVVGDKLLGMTYQTTAQRVGLDVGELGFVYVQGAARIVNKAEKCL